MIIIDAKIRPFSQTGRALFLDRDGIINVDKGWVYRISDVEWVEHVFDMVRAAVTTGHEIIIVTNQGGIARGYYSEADFRTISHWMMEEFAQRGLPITRIVGCPHHPGGSVARFSHACLCRKPQPGMILSAVTDLRLDAAASTLIGDKISDVEAALAAGVGRALLYTATSDATAPTVPDGVRVISSLNDPEWPPLPSRASQNE